jgi:hypothetical protein
MLQDCLQSDNRNEGDHYPCRDGENDPYQVGIWDVSHGSKAVLQKRQLVRRHASVSVSMEAGEWNWR